MSSLLRRTGEVAAGLGSPCRAEVLDDTHRDELIRLVDRDPIVNAVLGARLAALPSLTAHGFGGTVLGARDDQGRLAAAVFNGGNLLPVGGGERELIALADRLAERPRVCSSIVGRGDAVRTLWSVLAPVWGPQRAIRHRQPLLLVDDRASIGAADPRVRLMRPHDVDAYLPAAAAMFTEELGISPYLCVETADYRTRVAGLIRDKRAFGILDDDGTVLFKADLGAISSHTCQVQGVWVRPDRRGAGIGTAALAAVFGHALTLAPTVSLYVNDFNTAARRMYTTLGMRQIDTLTTVLF